MDIDAKARKNTLIDATFFNVLYRKRNRVRLFCNRFQIKENSPAILSMFKNVVNKIDNIGL